jgi:hypothetical protein
MTPRAHIRYLSSQPAGTNTWLLLSSPWRKREPGIPLSGMVERPFDGSIEDTMHGDADSVATDRTHWRSLRHWRRLAMAPLSYPQTPVGAISPIGRFWRAPSPALRIPCRRSSSAAPCGQTVELVRTRLRGQPSTLAIAHFQVDPVTVKDRLVRHPAVHRGSLCTEDVVRRGTEPAISTTKGAAVPLARARGGEPPISGRSRRAPSRGRRPESSRGRVRRRHRR